MDKWEEHAMNQLKQYQASNNKELAKSKS
jgi:hypothetical protein